MASEMDKLMLAVEIAKILMDIHTAKTDDRENSSSFLMVYSYARGKGWSHEDALEIGDDIIESKKMWEKHGKKPPSIFSKKPKDIDGWDGLANDKS